MIGYVAFLMIRVVWQNYEINQKIANLKIEIEEIKKQSKHLENLIVYYGSNIYREVEARRKLGLKKPGETIVPLPNLDKKEERKIDDKNDGVSKKNIEPNYLKWWELIVGS